MEIIRRRWYDLIMRYSKEHKETARRKIVDVAAKEFLRHGIAGFRVNDVMKGAGLTQGAFYGHFSSKEELVKEALHESSKRSRFVQQAENGNTLEDLICSYLQTDHRNHPEMGGCPAAALIGEINRHPKSTREALVSDMKKMISLIESRLPKTKSTATRTSTAIAIVSTMLGALQFARATTDAGLSKKILEASKEAALTMAKS